MLFEAGAGANVDSAGDVAEEEVARCCRTAAEGLWEEAKADDWSASPYRVTLRPSEKSFKL